MKAIIILLFSAAAITGCKKNTQSFRNCYPGSETLWKVDKAGGVVIRSGGQFYITQSGTIDTRFVPCDLPVEFQVDKMNIVFSGDVKFTKNSATEPCCTNDIVLTYISR
jgi:hypothetical protein